MTIKDVLFCHLEALCLTQYAEKDGENWNTVYFNIPNHPALCQKTSLSLWILIPR